MAMFKSASAPNAERPKTGRQSIRGRISAPIPISDPLDPSADQLPIPPSVADDPTTIKPAVPTASSPPPISSPTPTGARCAPTDDLQQLSGASAQAQPPRSASKCSQMAPANTTTTTTAAAAAATATTSDAAMSHALPTFRLHPDHPSSLRYSSANTVSDGTETSHGMDARPQRSKSGIRGALSKLFGRRKKTDSLSSARATPGLDNVPQHRSVRSDPTVLSRTQDLEAKRSASLPITEFDRALRSHSVGMGEITTIGSVHSSHHANSQSADADLGSVHRSRTTMAVTRMRLVQQMRRDGTGYGSTGDIFGTGGSEWTGLSPRPASMHGRGNGRASVSGGLITGANNSGRGGRRNLAAIGAAGTASTAATTTSYSASDNPDEIGRAITSDMPGGTDFGQKRRSRSLSGLRDLVLDQEHFRRRSDEIRYGRGSYDPAFLSPLQSDNDMDADGDGDGDMDIDADDEADDHGDDHAKRDTHDGHEDRFNFLDIDSLGGGPLRDSRSDSADAEPRGRHTRTATADGPQPFVFGHLSDLGARTSIDMDMRLQVLESRMHRVERVVDRICRSATMLDKSPDPASGLQASPRHSTSQRSDLSAHSTASATSNVQHSRMSFGEGRPYIGSLHPPSTSTPPDSSHLNSSGPRPISTTTVRETTSLFALGPAPVAELLRQIETERAARQALETQVKKLNDRINLLSTTMYAMLRDPTAKTSRSRETLSSPSTASLRDARRSPVSPPGPLLPVGTQAPSQTPSQTQSQGQSQPTSAVDAETTSEGFHTPLEETHPVQEDSSHDGGPGGNGTNSVDSVDNVVSSKKAIPVSTKVFHSAPQKRAIRTLSLSQLTLGRGRTQ